MLHTKQTEPWESETLTPEQTHREYAERAPLTNAADFALAATCFLHFWYIQFVSLARADSSTTATKKSFKRLIR